MKRGRPVITKGLRSSESVRLIDGVRDRFILDLYGTKDFKDKRTFTINTEAVKALLETFLSDELELFLKREWKEDREFIAEYLAAYLFQDQEEGAILEHFDIEVREFNNTYHSCLRGFKQCYKEDYV